MADDRKTKRKPRAKPKIPKAPGEQAEPSSSEDVVPSTASIFTRRKLSAEFSDAVRRLEREIGRPVWVLVHGLDHRLSPQKHPMEGLSGLVLLGLLEARRKLPNEPIAVLMDSPGGDAEAAYRLALVLRRLCGGFDVYVPRWAKSAATLFALGADRIVLGPVAELGPLDVQHKESRRKDMQSALNESQAIDRLHQQAIKAFDQTLFVVKERLELNGEEIDEFVPTSLDYVAKQFGPLFEKLDIVHWTKVSRLLRIGQDYATRLLERRYPEEEAEAIAHSLVEAYPDHSFMIDSDECSRIGLHTESPDGNLRSILDDLFDCLNRESFTAIGFLQDGDSDAADSEA